jgi:pimeloyl-ACP methyl ester carboxylesterase
MLLVDAAGLHVHGAPVAELFIDDFVKISQLLFHDANSPVVEEAMPLSLEDSRILLYLRAREATARVGWNPYLHNPKLPDHLHRITCPVKVLWGRDDKLIPLAHGERFVELLPSAELVVFDECGHMLPFEKPEAFVEEVVKFLGSS